MGVPKGEMRGWLTYALPALTILGLAAYGLIGLAYDAFYGPLGISPDEVGINYVQTLAEGGAGLIFTFVFGALLSIALFWVRDRILAALGREPVLGSRRIWLGIGVIATVALLLSAYIHASLRADDVRNGRSVVPEKLLGLITVVPLKAEPSQIIWLKNSAAPSTWTYGTCFMYLGNANGTSVFYAPQAQAVIRIPSGEVAVISQSKCGP